MAGVKLRDKIRDSLFGLLKEAGDVFGSTREATRDSAIDSLRQVKGHMHATIVRLAPPEEAGERLLYDATVDKSFCKFLLRAMRRRFKGQFGEISVLPTKVFRSVRGADEATLEPTPMKVE
jgi:hypothetical protein